MVAGIVSIGGIILDDFEIPDSINIGGAQRIAKLQLVGGARQVQAMGYDQSDKEWSGRFRGSDAFQRAQAVERLCIIGLPVVLNFLTVTLNVLIAEFHADVQRQAYEIPYRIVCTPTDAVSLPPAATTGIDALVGSDLGGVGSFISDAQSSITGAFADMAPALATASSALSTASQAIGGLNGLAGAPFSQVSGILTGLNNANTAIGGAITIGNGNILTGISQIGGVIPANPNGSLAALPGQIAGLRALSNLIVARGQTGRAINNVSNAGAAT
jgi:hypothetical protein